MPSTTPNHNQFPLSALLGKVQAQFVREYDLRLVEAGYADLSLSLGTNVLRHLGADGVRLNELAVLSGVTKQAISQQVAELQRRGYVTVEPDKDDQRAKRVRLTARGSESQQAARRLFAEQERNWARRYGSDLVGGLRQILEQIVADTEEADQPRG